MVLVNYINVLFWSYVKKVNLLGNLKIFVICVRVSLFKKPPPQNQNFFYYFLIIVLLLRNNVYICKRKEQTNKNKKP